MSKKLEIDIIGKNAGLKRALNDSKKDTESFGKSLSHLAKLASGAFLAFEGAKHVVGFFVDATKAASQMQQATARMSVTLKDNGIQWKGATKAVEAYLQKQADLTGFMRNELSDAFASDIRNTKNLTQAKHLLNVEEDLARTKGISLAAATSLVNRANLGSVIGLKKLGIAFKPVTDAQDAIIKQHQAMELSGKKLSKQDQIDYQNNLKAAKALDKKATGEKAVAAIAKQTHGQSAAYAKTEAGLIDRLKVKYDELQITIGKHILPTITKIAGFILKIADAKSLKVGIHVAWVGIEGMVKDLKTQLFGGDQITHIKVPVSFHGGPSHNDINVHSHVNGIVNDMQGAFDKINWGPIGQKIADGISAAMKFSDKAFNGILSAALKWANSHSGQIADIGLTIAVTMFNKLLDPSFWIAHWQIMGALALNLLSLAFPEGKILGIGEKFLANPIIKGALKLLGLKGVAEEAVLKLAIVFENMGASIGGKALTGVLDILGWISKGFGKLAPLVKLALTTGVIDEITNLVTKIPSEAEKIGKAIYHGIVSGLGDLKGLLGRWVKEALDALNPFSGGAPNPANRPGYAARSTTHRAGGGMIPGNYSAGDIHPAWLSGGEAVLNPTQIGLVGRDRVMNALHATGAPTNGSSFAKGKTPVYRAGYTSAPPATVSGFQAEYNQALKKEQTDAKIETGYKVWLQKHASEGHKPAKNKKNPHPDMTLYNAYQRVKQKLSDASSTGIRAILTADKAAVTAAQSKLRSARSSAKTAASNARTAAQAAADAIPGTDAFNSNIDALNAQLAADSYNGADLTTDNSNLATAYQNRIAQLRGYLPGANKTRTDAINQELASDYGTLQGMQSSSSGSSGSGGSGLSQDELAQVAQAQLITQNYQRGLALGAAAGAVINVNTSSFVPASAEHLQQIGTVVASALDAQPYRTSNSQTINV